MEIEVPSHTLSPNLADLSPRPKQIYDVNRETVASVLFSMDALPGCNARWSLLFEPSLERHEYFMALAAIPFRDYPDRGQREIEALIVPKAKLSTWLTARGKSLPAFLADTYITVRSADGQGSAAADSNRRLQGRPRKASWPRVVQLVHQLTNDHPDWQKKRLAFEAHKLARREFAKHQLPSIATIQRSMVGILRGRTR